MSKPVSRLFDFPYYQLQKYNLDAAFATKINNKWQRTSTKEYISKANTISRALLRLGIKSNDKVAFISSINRTEWNIFDIGVLQIGAQTVPIYPTISKEDYSYILNHSEATYCIVSDNEIIEKLNEIKGETKLKGIYTFDQIDGEKNWSELLELGKDESNQYDVERLKKSVKEDDLATLIYTSGTTGKPKGVMLSHKNIVSNALSCMSRVPIPKGEGKVLSFLPLCHIFERMLNYLYQYSGLNIYYAESISKISENAQEIKPIVMAAVPRLYEKIYDKIITKGSELKGIKKAIFFWAIKLGIKYQPNNENSWFYYRKLNLARKLVFKKWQEALGGEIQLMVSGSAALQPRLVRIFTAAGLPIMEGYGLTETSPVIAVNDKRNQGFKPGTVGKILDDVNVKISEIEEILVKGDNVMKGYYKDPIKTAKAFTEDGYFKTGDKGKFDKDGFLTITGRIKEMFKTSGGKYIIPNLIEDKLKQSRFVEQVMVVGESEKMATAFIQINFEWVKEWAKKHNIKDFINLSKSESVKHPRLLKRIQEEVDYCNSKFGKWERIKRFTITPDQWTVDSGHLTPTLKIKRKVILAKYKSYYEKMYDRA